MALISYPFENANTTEDQYTLLFRQFADSGIVRKGNDTLNYKVTTDGSGLDVQVSAGFAIVRGHAVTNDGPVTLTLAAASTQPRHDLIVLRLDPEANAITLAVKQGTPAATPVTPSATQTDTGIYELPLYRVAVPANALNVVAENITDWRRYTSSNVGMWGTVGRPVLEAGQTQLGYNLNTLQWEFWTGSEWRNLVRTSLTLRFGHTFTLVGPVTTATGQDYYIPPFWVAEPAGQTVKLAFLRGRLNGATNSSVTIVVTINGVDQPATQVAFGTTPVTTPFYNIELGNLTEVSIRVVGVSGQPVNFACTMFLDYSVEG